MNKQALIEYLEKLKNPIGIRDGMSLATEEKVINEIEKFINEMPAIRPEIMQFAEAMEAEMARHDAEKGDSWKDDSFTLETAYGAMLGHFENFRRAYVKEDKEAMAHEAVDNTNLWMMIFHKAKGE